jgi:hypothetical protein
VTAAPPPASPALPKPAPVASSGSGDGSGSGSGAGADGTPIAEVKSKLKKTGVFPASSADGEPPAIVSESRVANTPIVFEPTADNLYAYDVLKVRGCAVCCVVLCALCCIVLCALRCVASRRALCAALRRALCCVVLCVASCSV